ncbi:MAG: hypothetical protein LBM98_00525 [Oscillospiraceae bacterium]|jgi:hypothetical protein|nr:hypothetical protein [Oscillospiraceae bacterium]
MKRKHNHSKTKGVKTIPLAVAVATLSAGLTLGTGLTAEAAYAAYAAYVPDANRQEILIEVDTGHYITYNATRALNDETYRTEMQAAIEAAFKANKSILYEDSATANTFKELSKNTPVATDTSGGLYFVAGTLPSDAQVEVY